MSQNFPCSPQGGKLSLNPTCCLGKTILGGIYTTYSQEYKNDKVETESMCVFTPRRGVSSGVISYVSSKFVA